MFTFKYNCHKGYSILSTLSDVHKWIHKYFGHTSARMFYVMISPGWTNQQKQGMAKLLFITWFIGGVTWFVYNFLHTVN